jgi:hypothetical protein
VTRTRARQQTLHDRRAIAVQMPLAPSCCFPRTGGHRLHGAHAARVCRRQPPSTRQTRHAAAESSGTLPQASRRCWSREGERSPPTLDPRVTRRHARASKHVAPRSCSSFSATRMARSVWMSSPC